MQLVYLVTTGEYDYYAVRGVFSSEEGAFAAFTDFLNSDNQRSTGIEAMQVDIPVARLDEEIQKWRYDQNLRSEEIEDNRWRPYKGPTVIWNVEYDFYPTAYIVAQSSISPEHALDLLQKARSIAESLIPSTPGL